MKKLIVYLSMFLASLVAAAQAPSYTPNIQLQLPAYGQTNWQIPMNYDFTLLDRLLSGNGSLPGLSVSGQAQFPLLTTWLNTVTYSTGNVVFYNGTLYVSLISSNQGNAPSTSPSDWSTAVTGSGITSLAITVPNFLTSSCSSSPITSSGTCAITVANQTQGLFLASPASGSGPLAPRTIVGSDLPTTAVAPGSYTSANVTIGADGRITAASNGSGASTKVIYASSLSGVTGGQAIAPGSSASSAVDSSGPLNSVLANGNTKLILDGAYALSSSLVLYSGDTVECPNKNFGVIMMVSSNAPVAHNAHQNAPTTSSGTGGYLVSNQTDQNITVRGCTLNANSTQAVTGSNVLGTPHAVNPGTGLFVFGMDFDGVNNLTLEGNELYDTGAFSINFSNDSHILINGNYIHQPTPVVAEKNTDGPHFIGPDQYIVETNNTIIAGDDALPLNADDGNRTGSGDPNAPYIPTYVKWGWITDATLANNNINGSSFGLRMYAATELLDRIFITNTTGHICGNTGELTALTALGSGNIGAVRIDGWGVWTDGTCNSYGQPYNFIITQNYKAIQISGLQVQPTIYWPVITHSVSSPGVLSLRDWDVYSPSSSGFNLINLTGGAAPQVALSGLQWLDNASNTGSVFAGSVVPATVTCSNYSGPNRLLASGFSPSFQNGDCFTNSYNTAVTYINTVFGEHASGNLAGTTPATVNSPATGGWTLASGTDFTYTGSGSVTSSTTGAVPDVVSVGTQNYTLRVTASACGSLCGLAVRYTNVNNFTAINFGPTAAVSCGNGFAIYDVVSGTATRIANVCGLTTNGTYTVVLSGTSISVTGPEGNATATIANTGNSVGFINDANSAMTITAFSAKSF